MQLNMTTDYAVRILLYLGITGRITSSGEIAHEMVIPANYVPNIIKKLRDKGLVSARYGPKGGYELGKDANDITLLDVVETMEGSIKIKRCLEEDQYCSRDATAHCAIHDVYASSQSGLEETLAASTIAQLVKTSKAF